jgi:hypothetical protein
MSHGATFAQNSFNVGAKIGYGSSVFPMSVTLVSDGTSYPASSGATLSTGLSFRYMINDIIGIETGAWTTHYSFYHKTNFRTRDRYWKTAAALEILNHQLPIILNYRASLPRHPFTYLMISGGTTLDWFFPDILSGRRDSFKPSAFKNVVISIKRGKERPRSKMELGLEIQYAYRYFHFTNAGYQPTETSVISKTNMASLTLNYFFSSRQRTRTES